MSEHSNPRSYRKGINAALRAHQFDKARALEAELEAHFSENFNAMMILASLACRRANWPTAMARYESIRASFPSRFGRDVEPTTHYRRTILNSMGILAGSKKLPIELNSRSESTNALSDLEGFVFVSGMPRAGTTALGQLLAISPKIVLFPELYSPYLAYSPACFTPEGLDARVKEKNLRALHPDQSGAIGKSARTKVENAKAKLPTVDRAIFVGDKRPLFQYGLPQTLKMLMDRRVVVFHILRDCAHVAASYQKRANNPDDEWDPLRGLSNCIHEMNVTHRFIRDMEAGGGNEFVGPRHELLYVDYARVFLERDEALSLFSRLDIEVDPKMTKQLDALQEKSKQLMASPREINDSLRRALQDSLDFDAAEAVCKITGIDVLASIRAGA